MNQIKVGSRIVYQVESPTTFLFNISVAKNEHQPIVSEFFKVEPFHKIEECTVGPMGNRLVRLSVSPGQLAINYEAIVNLNADQVEAIEVGETPYEQLPADVLTYFPECRPEMPMDWAQDLL